MNDRIRLSGIELYAYGGVTEAEKQIGQRYRVDVELSLDLRKAGHSDSVDDTVHYGEVYATVVAVANEGSFNLIEFLAERIAAALLSNYPTQDVTVRVAKLLPPVGGVVDSAAVQITRVRGEAQAPRGSQVGVQT